VDDRILIEVIHGSHEAILEFLFGCDADVAQHRTSELGEEPFDEIEPGTVRGREGEFETACRMIVEDQLDRHMGPDRWYREA